MAGKEHRLQVSLPVMDAEQMTDYLLEVKSGKRIISIQDRIAVFVRPNLKVQTDSKIFYAKLYAMALSEGLPTRAKSRQDFLVKMKELGHKADDYYQRRDAIQKKLAENMQDTMDESKAGDILTSLPEMMKAVDANIKGLTKDELDFVYMMTDLQELEMSIMSNCAEAIVEQQTQFFRISQTTFNADGTLMWPTPDAMDAEDTLFIHKLREEYTRFEQGLPLFYEVLAPEQDDLPNESTSS